MFFFYDLFMVIKCDKYGFIGVYDIFLVIRLESGFQSFTKKKVEIGVVWNINFMAFHSVGNVFIPTDELHHFSVGIPPTSHKVRGFPS